MVMTFSRIRLNFTLVSQVWLYLWLLTAYAYASKIIRPPIHLPAYDSESLTGVRIGGNCEYDWDCDSYMTKCVQHNCQCSDQYLEHNNTCLERIVPLDEGCTLKAQCEAHDKNSICTTERVCGCRIGYRRERNRCQFGVLVGVNCNSDDQCEYSRATCENGRCRCAHTRLSYNGICIDDAVPLGGRCNLSIQCNYNENTDCSSEGKCQCRSGYRLEEGKCQRGMLLRGNCTTDYDCYSKNAKCFFGKCQCPLGTTEYLKDCILDTVTLGKKCVFDWQCQSDDFRSHCDLGVCRCRNEYDDVRKRCTSVSIEQPPFNPLLILAIVALVLTSVTAVFYIGIVISRRRRRASSRSQTDQNSTSQPHNSRPTRSGASNFIEQGIDPDDKPPSYIEAISAAPSVYSSAASLIPSAPSADNTRTIPE